MPQIREKNQSDAYEVTLAGKVGNKRVMGKAALFTLIDGKASVEIYAKEDELFALQIAFVHMLSLAFHDIFEFFKGTNTLVSDSTPCHIKPLGNFSITHFKKI